MTRIIAALLTITACLVGNGLLAGAVAVESGEIGDVR